MRTAFNTEKEQELSPGDRLALGLAFVFVFVMFFVFFKVVEATMGNRVSAEAELEGLDIPEMGALAYPDFVLGPGTPLGEAMRRYWMPACLSEELKENDGEPLRLRLLGEDLVAWRDSSGAVSEKKGNCPIELRAAVWLRHGGEKMDLNPANFHNALAEWLVNAGFVKADQTESVAAALYCLGVTNSNNLFQKVNQGKLVPMGIGKNGRRNAKGKK